MNDIIKTAQDLKISTSFCDACLGQEFEVKEEVLNFLIDKLYDENALRWQYPVEPIYIIEQDNLFIDVVCKSNDIKISKHKSEIIDIIDTNKSYNKYKLKILSDFDIGYHDIELLIEGKTYKTTLAVAPTKCYSNPKTQNKKTWGFSQQLYSLRSKSNWGVGDFSDLKKLAEIASKHGADLIGINPINLLNHHHPEDASPYSATSRLFINPIYIDVTKTKGYTKELIKNIDIEELRKIDIIDYTKVFETKIKVLKNIYKKPMPSIYRFLQQKRRRLRQFSNF